MIVQNRLTQERKPIFGTTWGKPQYNKVVGEVQRIELHRGCPHQHEYCYAPTEMTDFPIDLKEFRAKCRKHNQLVNFGIDPEGVVGRV